MANSYKRSTSPMFLSHQCTEGKKYFGFLTKLKSTIVTKCDKDPDDPVVFFLA